MEKTYLNKPSRSTQSKELLPRFLLGGILLIFLHFIVLYPLKHGVRGFYAEVTSYFVHALLCQQLYFGTFYSPSTCLHLNIIFNVI